MKRLAIFAGYDKDNIIDDYVVYYIKELKKIADIIYVSDCNIIENELEKIKDYCIHIINERHGEYDFGSYKRGYLYAYEKDILKDYDYLILCNDSCYGPFFNFQKIVENMENKNTDVWGIFECLKDEKNDEHLQSYFLSLKQKVYLSEYFYNFMYSIKKENNKLDIIKKYEIGLSNLLKKKNVSITSFLDSNIKEKMDINNNIPFYNPYIAIKKGFPFLKIASFKNHFYTKLYINVIYDILNYVKIKYDVSLIVSHLNRIIREDEIKYFFPRFKTKQINIASKSFFNVYFQYSVSGKFQIVFILFNKLKFSIDLPKSISYIDYKYKNFDFLLKRIE